jgi:hypothetical protein
LGSVLYEQTGSWAMGFYGSALLALVAAMMSFGLKTSRAAAPAVAVAPAVATK